MAIKKTTKRKHGKMQKGGKVNTSKIVAEIQQEQRLGRQNYKTSAAAEGEEYYTHVKTLTPAQIRKYLLTSEGQRRHNTPYLSTGSNRGINYDAFTPDAQRRIAANAAQPGALAGMQPVKGLITKKMPAVFNSSMYRIPKKRGR